MLCTPAFLPPPSLSDAFALLCASLSLPAAPLHRAQKLLQSTDEDVSGHDVASVLPLLRR